MFSLSFLFQMYEKRLLKFKQYLHMPEIPLRGSGALRCGRL